MAKEKTVPPKLQMWIETRRKYRLSDSQIQMARELGMNPKKFGGLANHKQEPWKVPLPQFIEECYRKRFRKDKPDQVRSIEGRIAHQEKKRALRKLDKQARVGNPREDGYPIF